MSCPTCQHTMQNLGVEGRRIFWCPRCGTLKEFSGDFERVETTINTRHIFEAARLEPAQRDRSQHTSVEVVFKVDQYDVERPRLEQMIFKASGRRLF